MRKLQLDYKLMEEEENSTQYQISKTKQQRRRTPTASPVPQRSIRPKKTCNLPTKMARTKALLPGIRKRRDVVITAACFFYD